MAENWLAWSQRCLDEMPPPKNARELEMQNAIQGLINHMDEKPFTVGRPTTAPDTTAEQWPAEEPTGPETPASSQSDPDSLTQEAVVKAYYAFADRLAVLSAEYRTRAQAARLLSSTSAMQEAPSFADSPARVGSSLAETEAGLTKLAEVVAQIRALTREIKDL